MKRCANNYLFHEKFLGITVAHIYGFLYLYRRHNHHSDLPVSGKFGNAFKGSILFLINIQLLNKQMAIMLNGRSDDNFLIKTLNDK